MPNRQIFIRLTALWAFIEAGLGGFLHALHLPFTGLVLGGFALLIISLLAKNSPRPFFDIIAATMVVIAIKALVNPSTPAAFLAVGFQGVLGACVYSISKNCFVSHFIFGTFSMLESAAQKLLMLTIFFGKTFWEGLDGLGLQVAKIFGFSPENMSNKIVLSYLGIFFIWGVLLAIWMYQLPQQIEKRKNWYKINKQEINTLQINKNNKSIKILFLIFLLIALSTFFWNKEKGLSEGLIYLFRTLGIFSFWQLLLLPFLAKGIAKWSNTRKDKDPLLHDVQNTLPSVKSTAPYIYKMVQEKFSGLRKWKEFVLALIVLNVYHQEQ
jgi:hypothetical protein